MSIFFSFLGKLSFKIEMCKVQLHIDKDNQLKFLAGPFKSKILISFRKILVGHPVQTSASTNHQFLHLLLWMLKYFLPRGKCTYYPFSPLFLRKSVWCVMSLNFDLENFANNLLGFGALEVYHPSCSPFSITFDIRYTCISLTDTDYSRLPNRRRPYVYWFWIFFYGLG